ncbi:hypothetical protein BGW80DRAFT_1380299, partial [Lactifluus volemus]
MSFNDLKISNSEDCCIINASPHPDELRIQVRWFLSMVQAPVLRQTLTLISLHSTLKSSLTPCPKCDKPFRRMLDLKRHILSVHLPCWVYCSRSGCTWRGHRKDQLKRHLYKQKCGSKPWDQEYKIFEPRIMLNWILKDHIPVGVAASYALVFVGERAVELRKEMDWMDLWGRRGRMYSSDMAIEPPAVGLIRNRQHHMTYL